MNCVIEDWRWRVDDMETLIIDGSVSCSDTEITLRAYFEDASYVGMTRCIATGVAFQGYIDLNPEDAAKIRNTGKLEIRYHIGECEA